MNKNTATKPTKKSQHVNTPKPPKKPRKSSNKKVRGDSKKAVNNASVKPRQSATPSVFFENKSLGMFNPSGATKELVFKKSFYRDWSNSTDGTNRSCYQFAFDTRSNNPFAPELSGSAQMEAFNICRIKTVKVYALPRFSLDTGASGIVALYSLPVQAGGELSDVAGSNQKSTFLTPTAISDWVYIGGFNQQKTFSTSTLLPAVDKAHQVIGTVAFVAPETGDPVRTPSSNGIQIRFDVIYAVTIPNLLKVELETAYETYSDANSPTFAGLTQVLDLANSDGPCIASVLGVQNET